MIKIQGNHSDYLMMAVLKMVQDGLLDLDENVNDKLVSWKVPENDSTREKAVTLRGLLNHSAGVTVHGFRGYAHDEDVPTLIQVLNMEISIMANNKMQAIKIE